MGNSEDKSSSILAFNSGLEQDMKFKLSPLSFSQAKDYSCIPLMCFLHDFNFSWKSLFLVLNSLKVLTLELRFAANAGTGEYL